MSGMQTSPPFCFNLRYIRAIDIAHSPELSCNNLNVMVQLIYVNYHFIAMGPLITRLVRSFLSKFVLHNLLLISDATSSLFKKDTCSNSYYKSFGQTALQQKYST